MTTLTSSAPPLATAPAHPAPGTLGRHADDPPASASRRTRMAIDCRLDYELDGPCDFVFLILPSLGMGQTMHHEVLSLSPSLPSRTVDDVHSGNRVLRVTAPAGRFSVGYRALVDRHVDPPEPHAPEVAIAELPDEVLRFLSPTRYCESDHLGPAAQQLFGGLPPGHGRVQAVADWVKAHITYRLGSSTPLTTARDVFVQRAGVCRDFAHLSVAMCRALNIPARVVGGYAKFPEPPPDFHAVFEAFLGGRWVMFDPTGLAPVEHLVRVATGSDAKDVAFATIFGPARMVSMSPEVALIEDGAAPVEADAPRPTARRCDG
jgi:transglutaminase-like putative cysteine protease